MRAARATLVVIVGLAVGGSASASSTAETIPGKVFPGAGVGKLRLGMTESSAQRVLRPLGPRRRHRRSNPRSVPRGYAEYEHPSFENGFGATTYIVGFQPRRGARRVVMIDIRTARNATARGARVSTPLQRLRELHPRVRCKEVTPQDIRHLCYLGPDHRRAQTVFVIGGTLIIGQPLVLKVVRIIVREPGFPLLRR